MSQWTCHVGTIRKILKKVVDTEAQPAIIGLEARRASMSHSYGNLYHEMVVEPAQDASEGILLDTVAREDLLRQGLDPDTVLASIRELADQHLRELLRPAFYRRVEELGVYR